MLPFDAHLDFYKSIKGAIAAGECLRLRVLLPRSFGVSACTLALTRDGNATEYIPMQWEHTDGIEEWWSITLPFRETGLWFYHFEYTTGWGTSILRRKHNTAQASLEGTEDWQQTVYPKGFHTPDAFKGGLIYQIFPDRFYDSGSPKQNVPTDATITSTGAMAFRALTNTCPKMPMTGASGATSPKMAPMTSPTRIRSTRLMLLHRRNICITVFIARKGIDCKITKKVGETDTYFGKNV